MKGFVAVPFPEVYRDWEFADLPYRGVNLPRIPLLVQPGDELRQAGADVRGGSVAKLPFSFAHIGECAVHIAGLERQVCLYRLLAKGDFELGDEIVDADGPGFAKVVNLVADASIHGRDDSVDNVVDVGEVAHHRAVAISNSPRALLTSVEDEP